MLLQLADAVGGFGGGDVGVVRVKGNETVSAALLDAGAAVYDPDAKRELAFQRQILNEIIENAKELPVESQNLLLVLAKGMAYTRDCITKRATHSVQSPKTQQQVTNKPAENQFVAANVHQT